MTGMEWEQTVTCDEILGFSLDSGVQLRVDCTWLMIYSVMKKVSLLLVFFMSPNYYIVLSSVE